MRPGAWLPLNLFSYSMKNSWALKAKPIASPSALRPLRRDAPPWCRGVISGRSGLGLWWQEESLFPLRMASSCSRWKCFLGEVFCFIPRELKSYRHYLFLSADAKSLVNRAWSQRQPCFSMNTYDSQASPHAVCLGDFGERWPQWCVILILSSLKPLPGFPHL